MVDLDVLSARDRSVGEHKALTGMIRQAAESEGKLLLVDDQPTRRRSLHAKLFCMGLEIAEALSGEEAFALCRIFRYDAVLLAIDGRGIMDGLGMSAELRRLLGPRSAILVMSPSDNEQSKIDALDAGADDYVTPSHMRELIARVRAALRRSRAADERRHERIAVGDIEIFRERRLVLKANKAVHLTPKEFNLLQCLMSHAGFPVSHARLLREVWGGESANQVEYLRTYMVQLRRKLEDDPGHPRYLLTHSHVGYRFVEAPGCDVP